MRRKPAFWADRLHTIVRQKGATMENVAFYIKEFDWEYSEKADIQTYSHQTPFGLFTVSRWREDFDESKPWLSWRWNVCFREYYDEYEFLCESAEKGKKQAFEFWVERLLPALEISA